MSGRGIRLKTKIRFLVMEQRFIGVEVRVALQDGRRVEGVIENVAPEADLLLLRDACRRTLAD